MKDQANITKRDLGDIYSAMVRLAEGEGCTVLSALIEETDSENGQRIYDEVFSAKNMA